MSFATLWSIACQASLSTGFSRQEYWSGLPRPPPGDLPDPGMAPPSPVAPALQVDSLPLSHQGKPEMNIHTPLYVARTRLYNTGNYTQYLAITSSGKESEK